MDAEPVKQTVVRPAYGNLDKQFIGGDWRDGRADKTSADVDPFTGRTIAEIALADHTDLDDAYRSARDAQRDWAAALPNERAAVFRRASSILEERREEVVSWLVRESGSTRLKANLEW